MSCVGHARCEMSLYDEVKAHRSVINEFLDEMHRPSFPYKFKFKFSGCPNDCVNAIHRADFAADELARRHEGRPGGSEGLCGQSWLRRAIDHVIVCARPGR